MADLVEILASDKRIMVGDDPEPVALSSLVAEAVCELVRQGAELGDLERYTFTRGDQEIEGSRIPRVWLERLARAADVGAFRRKSAIEIAAIIITQPAPGAAA